MISGARIPNDVKNSHPMSGIAVRLFLVGLAIGIVGTVGCRQRTPSSAESPLSASEQRVPNKEAAQTASLLIQERAERDATVWADEVTAQRYEQVFTQLWDRLRQADDAWEVLLDAAPAKISIGGVVSSEDLELGIRRIRYGDPDNDMTRAEFAALVDRFRRQGFRLVESEWHHSRFVPAQGSPSADTPPTQGDTRTVSNESRSGPTSEFSFVLHVQRPTTSGSTAKELRAIARGTLTVDWSAAAASKASARPSTAAASMRLSDVEIVTRSGSPPFEHVLSYARRETDVSSAHPIILRDLDRNGFDDIVISRWNRVYDNQGSGQFVERRFLEHYQPHGETGTIADFDGDGYDDFLTVGKQGQMLLFRGTLGGQFPNAGHIVARPHFDAPLAVTVGDIDGDNDLDVWQTQYRLSYQDGHMPTPYFDANDGFPASLLLNDGRGQFDDVTESAGLAEKRFRRTYSTSFVDLDDDGDLDLLVVSDFAGLDAYQNDGLGHFTPVAAEYFGETHLFGMSHTMADFNLDGRLDLYAIGMSSTTARRLDRMNLGRDDRPEVHQMRAQMGFGNRMFLRRPDGSGYVTPSFAASVARTGWSWGTTSFDFDNDGDIDIYVANGFRSGKSTQDYCTRFWCHDLYIGSSRPDSRVKSVLANSLRDLDRGEISWNGFEHNSLLLNLDGNDFLNVGFLMGVGCEFDSRAVTGNDLDGDGRVDLLLSRYEYDGRGFVMSLYVFRNSLSTANRWIGVRLDAAPPGTKVELTTSNSTQVRVTMTGDSFGAQHGNQVHFGLGDVEVVDRIDIRKPNRPSKRLLKPSLSEYHSVK